MKFIELGGWAGIWLISRIYKKSRNLGDKYDLMFVCCMKDRRYFEV
ncbi:hypothetical protein [Helicobacter pullorum]|nr:hypothetical protein [Helicobacter pullorum]